VKTVNLLFPLILSCMMSFLIAGITTLKTVGFIDNLFSAWIVTWIFAHKALFKNRALWAI